MDFRAIGDRVRNWGRWGDDDERGTLNLITPDKLVAAGALIRSGKVFDLGIPFGSGGPQPGRSRINPVLLVSETGADQHRPGAFHFADDYIFMPLQSASQWDALGHVFYDDQLYNGFSASENITPHGAHHCSITAIAKGIAGRGVLLDIARLKGVEWLEAGYAITPADLDTTGLDVAADDLHELLSVDADGWKAAVPQIREHFAQFGDRLPAQLSLALDELDGKLAGV